MSGRFVRDALNHEVPLPVPITAGDSSWILVPSGFLPRKPDHQNVRPSIVIEVATNSKNALE